MHLSNALGVAEIFDAKGLHNIISDVLHVVMVDTSVLSTHAFPQLEQ